MPMDWKAGDHFVHPAWLAQGHRAACQEFAERRPVR
jgi:hypothetical protein